MSKCKICGKDGFHKLSCTNNTARVVIPMSYIPTLEGDEAEDFIRKADNTKKGSIDWSKQIEDCKKILEKSEIPIYLAANNHRNS